MPKSGLIVVFNLGGIANAYAAINDLSTGAYFSAMLSALCMLITAKLLIKIELV